MPPGRGRGVSVQHVFGSYVAQVAEVEVSGSDVRVTRVVAAVDCGTQVNPDIIVAQMQSGIIFGVSGALYGEITLKDGRVQQSNFSDYRVLRINESPVIEVHLVPSTRVPRAAWGSPAPRRSCRRLRTPSSPPPASGSGSSRSQRPWPGSGTTTPFFITKLTCFSVWMFVSGIVGRGDEVGEHARLERAALLVDAQQPRARWWSSP